jgi:hypothetical protein
VERLVPRAVLELQDCKDTQVLLATPDQLVKRDPPAELETVVTLEHLEILVIPETQDSVDLQVLLVALVPRDNGEILEVQEWVELLEPVELLVFEVIQEHKVHRVQLVPQELPEALVRLDKLETSVMLEQQGPLDRQDQLDRVVRQVTLEPRETLDRVVGLAVQEQLDKLDSLAVLVSPELLDLKVQRGLQDHWDHLVQLDNRDHVVIPDQQELLEQLDQLGSLELLDNRDFGDYQVTLDPPVAQDRMELKEALEQLVKPVK